MAMGKPTGALKHVLRAPAWVFRARLGFIFGRRIVMLEHIGRRSGKLRRTPLEVVQRDGDAYVLCSGTGPDADWWRNIKAQPASALWVGSKRCRVDQRFLDGTEAATVLAGYEHAHPKAAQRLLALLDREHDGTHAGRIGVVGQMPMVEFRLEA